jgi:hypothetical protein
MFKGYVLNIASWLLLRDVLRPVMLVAGLVCWRTWPVFFSAVGVLVPSMVAIELGFWVRGKIVPRYTEDQFARKSLRFKGFGLLSGGEFSLVLRFPSFGTSWNERQPRARRPYHYFSGDSIVGNKFLTGAAAVNTVVSPCQQIGVG